MYKGSEKVSIIIPIYNVQAYLAACLHSVIDQDHGNIEIIAIDDGSTDCSLTILKELSQAHQNIIPIVMQHNGQSAARNAGLAAATGDFIIFLDSDDYLNENAVSTCVDWLQSQGCDIVFFSARPFSDGLDPQLAYKFNYERRGELIRRKMPAAAFFSQSISLNNYIPSACLYMYRRSVLQDVFFYDGIVHEDNLFTAQLLMKNVNANVVCIPDKLLNRRLRPGSIMTEPKENKHIRGYIAVAEELLKLVRGNENTESGKAVARLIQENLVATMRTSRVTYGNRFPMWLRIRVLRLLSKLKVQMLRPKCVAVCVVPELLVARVLIANLFS